MRKTQRPKWDRVKNCKLCGDKFEAYRQVDLFCCTAHRVAWHRKRDAEAYRVLSLQADPQRLELMQKAMESGFVRDTPKTKIELTPAQVRRMNQLTEFDYGLEAKPNFAKEVTESRPNFICSEAVESTLGSECSEADSQALQPTPGETWPCEYCDQRWAYDVGYCTCPQSPKAPTSETDF